MGSDFIIIKGAREHNLKNINLKLPRNKLIVITGLSGSGKSSLAFDTIYAEGQRRYVESLSAYARQFLDKMEKPDVDYIEGLSPAISIEQKTTHRNPRSTVGTITEIYDYLRLLFARCGDPYCYKCGKSITSQSIDQMVDEIFRLGLGTKLQILSPIAMAKKGEFKKELANFVKDGFTKIRIDGAIIDLDEPINLDKNKKHNIDVIIDRIVIKEGVRERLVDSLEMALKLSDGLVTILYQVKNEKDYQEKVLSEKFACIDCGISIPEIQPRLFSFNAPHGACPECHGIGERTVFDPNLIIPDQRLSILDGAIASIGDVSKSTWYRAFFEALAKTYKFDLNARVEDLKPEIIDVILYGSSDKEIDIKTTSKNGKASYQFQTRFEGLIPRMDRLYKETNSDDMKDYYSKFMKTTVCPFCKGERLRPESLAIKIDGKSISDVTKYSVKNALAFFSILTFDDNRKKISDKILKEIKDRINFLNNVGLNYINLNRKAATLSGGEMQRIRLATQIGSQLVGVLYILDEPTIGLHQRDNKRLLETLLHLKEIGNTLIVVEHDEQTICAADYVVDLGPGAGVNGGNIVSAGTIDTVLNNEDSLTGKYLSKKLKIEIPIKNRIENATYLKLSGLTKNNLKDIDVSIPLGELTVVTGVSGSGKSSLVNETLFPALAKSKRLGKSSEVFIKSIDGTQYINKVINIDQAPIGRTPRSNPATYTGLFTPIRELFSNLPESKIRGYKAGRFSFNVKGGRCETCQGGGEIKIEMHFLSDVYVTCDVCKGKRYNQETLEVKYKGKNISEVLDMSVSEALDFFENIPSVFNKLKTLNEVGLTYIKLGQAATTLSGGEAQRIKLSTELSKKIRGKTLYLLDEPTTGLHFDDVKRLINVLNALVEGGNTMVVIEHNSDVIKVADYIIDLGPEGGDEGGTLVFAGSPKDLIKHPTSYTGKYLLEHLKNEAIVL